ncbi:glycosyltransferase family 1 protein [Clostridium sp. CM028]|uniref:glycosyltransferase family 1 protein n=1 Tax=Clostridium sp. CM028 TaxID=2851575 RepID=UPI001C6F34D0|nr:glycosyltransferase family 1 protein [Clostridium sp. CM028]MBW9148506.1 glycosyltransferase family 1 protein [Clostridium sp. CM028]WLC61077.1 glycosyltransferase family 1 protein [Clostridium sp. CM028]
MNQIRVLVVTTTYLGYDGITSVIMNYYRNIDRSKVQFDFALGHGAEEWVKEEIEKLGGEIYELPSRKKKTFRYIKELKRLIDKNNYKIVHAHGNSGTLYFDIHAAKCAKVPVRIAHCHNSTCNNKVVHYLLKLFLNNETTIALACSKLAGDWLYNKPYTILNNGIQIEKFIFNNSIREEYRKKLGITDNFVLGHIGHFSYQKNHEFLLDVFFEVHKMNPKAKLMLVGDGNLRADIDKKINDLGLDKDVLILGKRKDVSQLIHAMDVFVFPSRFEGLPVVLVEVQASGLHCIVADTVTQEAQITGKVEYISLDKTPLYWAEQIIKYKDTYKRDNACEVFLESEYNIENEAKRLQEIYLLNSGR